MKEVISFIWEVFHHLVPCFWVSIFQSQNARLPHPPLWTKLITCPLMYVTIIPATATQQLHNTIIIDASYLHIAIIGKPTIQCINIYISWIIFNITLYMRFIIMFWRTYYYMLLYVEHKPADNTHCVDQRLNTIYQIIVKHCFDVGFWHHPKRFRELFSVDIFGKTNRICTGSPYMAQDFGARLVSIEILGLSQATRILNRKQTKGQNFVNS